MKIFHNALLVGAILKKLSPKIKTKKYTRQLADRGRGEGRQREGARESERGREEEENEKEKESEDYCGLD